LAVVSHLPGLDAVGTIIKQSGKYIKEIEELLYNERIEVIPYDTKLEDYIVNVCAPASILGYNLVETPTEQGTIDRKITIVCEQEKMALLIGSKGKNAQLISKLLKATIEFATPAEAYESGINIVPVEAYQQRNRFANNNATAVSFEDRMAQFKKVGVNQSQRTSVNNHQPKENRKVDKKPQEDTNSSMSFADRMAQFKDISDNSDNSNKNGE
jgi:transcription antitermination factor NusA-like protein